MTCIHKERLYIYPISIKLNWTGNKRPDFSFMHQGVQLLTTIPCQTYLWWATIKHANPFEHSIICEISIYYKWESSNGGPSWQPSRVRTDIVRKELGVLTVWLKKTKKKKRTLSSLYSHDSRSLIMCACGTWHQFKHFF